MNKETVSSESEDVDSVKPFAQGSRRGRQTSVASTSDSQSPSRSSSHRSKLDNTQIDKSKSPKDNLTTSDDEVPNSSTLSNMTSKRINSTPSLDATNEITDSSSSHTSTPSLDPASNPSDQVIPARKVRGSSGNTPYSFSLQLPISSLSDTHVKSEPFDEQSAESSWSDSYSSLPLISIPDVPQSSRNRSGSLTTFNRTLLKHVYALEHNPNVVITPPSSKRTQSSKGFSSSRNIDSSTASLDQSTVNTARSSSKAINSELDLSAVESSNDNDNESIVQLRYAAIDWLIGSVVNNREAITKLDQVLRNKDIMEGRRPYQRLIHTFVSASDETLLTATLALMNILLTEMTASRKVEFWNMIDNSYFYINLKQLATHHQYANSSSSLSIIQNEIPVLVRKSSSRHNLINRQPSRGNSETSFWMQFGVHNNASVSPGVQFITTPLETAHTFQRHYISHLNHDATTNWSCEEHDHILKRVLKTCEPMTSSLNAVAWGTASLLSLKCCAYFGETYGEIFRRLLDENERMTHDRYVIPFIASQIALMLNNLISSHFAILRKGTSRPNNSQTVKSPKSSSNNTDPPLRYSSEMARSYSSEMLPSNPTGMIKSTSSQTLPTTRTDGVEDLLALDASNDSEIFKSNPSILNQRSTSATQLTLNSLSTNAPEDHNTPIIIDQQQVDIDAELESLLLHGEVGTISVLFSSENSFCEMFVCTFVVFDLLWKDMKGNIRTLNDVLQKTRSLVSSAFEQSSTVQQLKENLLIQDYLCTKIAPSPAAAAAAAAASPAGRSGSKQKSPAAPKPTKSQPIVAVESSKSRVFRKDLPLVEMTPFELNRLFLELVRWILPDVEKENLQLLADAVSAMRTLATLSIFSWDLAPTSLITHFLRNIAGHDSTWIRQPNLSSQVALWIDYQIEADPNGPTKLNDALDILAAEHKNDVKIKDSSPPTVNSQRLSINLANAQKQNSQSKLTESEPNPKTFNDDQSSEQSPDQSADLLQKPSGLVKSFSSQSIPASSPNTNDTYTHCKPLVRMLRTNRQLNTPLRIINKLFEVKIQPAERKAYIQDLANAQALSIMKSKVWSTSQEVKNELIRFQINLLTYDQPKFDPANWNHEQLLREIWVTAFPTIKVKYLAPQQWAILGFRKCNSLADFRGVRILALQNLIHFSKSHVDIFKHLILFNQANAIPFGDCGVALTSMLLKSFTTDQILMPMLFDETDDGFAEIYDIVWLWIIQYWIEDQNTGYETLLSKAEHHLRDVMSSNKPVNAAEFMERLGASLDVIKRNWYRTTNLADKVLPTSQTIPSSSSSNAISPLSGISSTSSASLLHFPSSSSLSLSVSPSKSGASPPATTVATHRQVNLTKIARMLGTDAMAATASDHSQEENDFVSEFIRDNQTEFDERGDQLAEAIEKQLEKNSSMSSRKGRRRSSSRGEREKAESERLSRSLGSAKMGFPIEKVAQLSEDDKAIKELLKQRKAETKEQKELKAILSKQKFLKL